MEQITVKQLLKYCQNQVAIGNGDKKIVLSDDNEGNGYHGMFYGFTPLEKDNINDFEDCIYDSNANIDNVIILG